MTQAISSTHFRHLSSTDHTHGDHIQSTGQNHLVASTCAQGEACIILVELWLYPDSPCLCTPMYTASYQAGKHSKGKVLIWEPHHKSRNIGLHDQFQDPRVCFRHEHGRHQIYLNENKQTKRNENKNENENNSKYKYKNQTKPNQTKKHIEV